MGTRINMQVSLKRSIDSLRFQRRIFSELHLKEHIEDEYFLLITTQLKAAEIAIEELFRHTKRDKYDI